MKRLVYLSIAFVLLVGLLPTPTAAQVGGLYLAPESQQGTTTCWDAEAYYTLELTNDTGADSFFDITVSALFPTNCPAQVYAAAAETVSFECAVGVPFGGVSDTATITVSGQGYSDSATATTLVDRTGEWAAQPPSPFATQFSPVISWDDKLYVLGMDDGDRGVPPDGQVLIWDGLTWTLGAASGHYSTVDTDACLGLDADGNPVIDLVSSQPYGSTFSRYDINSDTWTTTPLPSGYPGGANNAEIVSMLQHTGENVCYVTGGWSYSGIPYYSPLYAYDPAAQTWTSLGSFTYAAADLRDHFAWYVPWVEGGAICIAGGRTYQDTPPYDIFYADSQCFVPGADVFNAPNADLGPLPEPWHYGGDAWRENEGQYEIWGFHGWGTEQQSFYAAPGQGFSFGPDTVHEFVGTEGDNYNGAVWAGNGATAGYWPSTLQESLRACPASCVAPSGAGFGLAPAAPTILEPVTFTASRPAGTGPRTYAWDLGDGATATGKTVQHTYTAPGDYTVTLTVANECGSTVAQAIITVIGVPDIVLTPSSLEAMLEPDSQVDQTLSVCNQGTEPLTWVLAEAPGTKAATPALSQATRSHPVSRPPGLPPDALPRPLTGKLPPASGVAGRPVHPDSVLWEQLPELTYSIYSDLWADPELALWTSDDFENAEMWQIDTIHVPGGMQTGSLANAQALHWCLYPDAGGAPAGDPFVGGEAWCWSTLPTDPAVTIGGGFFDSDVTLDVVAGQGAPLLVPAGHWWLLFYPEFATFPSDVFAVLLTETTNLAFANFLDPADYLGMGMTSWTSLANLGVSADMAFRLEGIEVTYDIPWLGEDPASGMVLPGECADVTVAFSSAGLDVGTYTGNLVFYSNDPDTPEAAVPVSLAVELPGPKISVSPTSLVAEQCPDTQTTQTLDVCSIGSEELTWSLAEDIDWLSADLLGGTLAPGDCDSVTVTFDSTALWPDSFFDVFTVDSNDAHHPQVTVSVQMTVLEPAHDPDFTWIPALPTLGEPVTFTGTAAGSEPIDYTWDLGDGGGGGGAVVQHTYAAAGDYLVTLTVSNACGQASMQHTVTVVAPDIAVSPASLTASVCPDGVAQQALQVCNEGGADLVWSASEDLPWLTVAPTAGTLGPGDCDSLDVDFFGPGSDPFDGIIAFSSNDPDEPVVNVLVSLTVLEPVHDADFSWDPASPHANQQVTFTGTAQGDGPINYAWAFNTEGGTEGDNPVTKRFAVAGDYTVSMWAWNACGQQLAQHTVTVDPAPSLMRVQSIRMSYVDRGMGRYTVLGKVRIVDAARVAVPGATVHVEWTAPDGATTAHQALTTLTGLAAFKVPTMQTGTWQLCVTDVVLAGWVYDPVSNLETCDTVTIP